MFTDFHKYVMPNRRTIRNVADDGNNRFDFVVKFLNYAFFYRQVGTLEQITVPVVKEYLNAYGAGTLPGDTKGRTKQTVERCVASILDFMDNLSKDRKKRCAFRLEDLYRMIPTRDHRGKIVMRKTPVFDVVYTSKPRDIFRDIPNAAFELLFCHIAQYHERLLMLVSLSAFSGLRPAEACNVRREDSPLGPGVLFTIQENIVSKIQIDLREELCLRSDLKPTGAIKKERMQTVPFIFTDALLHSYNRYMEYLKGKKYESDYGALSVNSSGKAMTYDAYYQAFHKIVKEEIIPLFLSAEDPEVVNYGRLLIENNISPHVFRHWYTVQLVLSGYDNVAELMEARGDTSPQSALTYLQNKGELEKRYRKINNEMFDYFAWAAQKRHGENE